MSLSRTIKRTIRERRTGSRVPEATRRRRFRRDQYRRGLEPAAVKIREALAFGDVYLQAPAPAPRRRLFRRRAG